MQKEKQLKSCYKKSLSSPKFSVGYLPYPMSLFNQVKRLCFMREAEDPGTLRAAKPSGMTCLFNNTAFTLIELLVVVLIIGILAAVALPQYQKAVEKSKATQAQTLLKSVYQAAKAYQLANGNWPSSFDELTVEIPWTGNKNWAAVGHYRQGISNNDWSIQLRAPLSDAGPTSNASGVVIGRISGPYKGAGFQIYQQTFSAIANTVPTDEVHCIEGKSASLHPQTTFSKTTGSYCIKLFKGTKVADSGVEYIYRL